MKIIDAHFHIFPDDKTDSEAEAMLRQVGHEPGTGSLLACYAEHDFVHGVIMGNGPLSPASHVFPDTFHYCVGLDSNSDAERVLTQQLDLLETHLRREQCCGIKLYPGYVEIPLNDPIYEPVYRLAEKYNKPVAVHMGQTAGSWGLLKYAHPMQLDEPACRHPDVQFVMCHFGNPFLPDAAAVVERNPNVAADLSGLLVGITDLNRYFARQHGYVDMLRGWLEYVDDWSRFMFGTDFPAVNLQNYADFCARLIPPEHHQAFFFDNANRIYNLGL